MSKPTRSIASILRFRLTNIWRDLGISRRGAPPIKRRISDSAVGISGSAVTLTHRKYHSSRPNPDGRALSLPDGYAGLAGWKAASRRPGADFGLRPRIPLWGFNLRGL